MSPLLASHLVAATATQMVALYLIASRMKNLAIRIERERRQRNHLRAAADALSANDFTAAIENYKRALDLKRSPAVLLALGQVYVRRKTTRPYAYKAFKDAMESLASTPSETVHYGGAKISLRGLAGLQILSTADVMGDRYPEFFDEEVTNAVNATIYSFNTVARQQETQYEDKIPNAVVTPSLFSAALNRYFAAQTACQYPLLEDRGSIVNEHIRAAIRDLGLVAQYDESRLRAPISNIRQLWAVRVLPQEDAEALLAVA